MNAPPAEPEFHSEIGPVRAPIVRSWVRWSPAIFWTLAPLCVISGFLRHALDALRSSMPVEGTMSVVLAAVLVFLIVLSFLGLLRRRRDHFAAFAFEGTIVTRVASDIATVGGAGLAPVAPGTFGSVAALPLAWILSGTVGWVRIVALAATSAAAFAAIHRYLLHRPGDADPGEIVADELVGVLLAIAFVPWRLPWIAAAFALFRALDIAKPGPIGYVERRFTGAAGVLLDDIVAGVIAGAVLATTRWALS